VIEKDEIPDPRRADGRVAEDKVAERAESARVVDREGHGRGKDGYAKVVCRPTCLHKAVQLGAAHVPNDLEEDIVVEMEKVHV
jgi:hypothetical protein